MNPNNSPYPQGYAPMNPGSNMAYLNSISPSQTAPTPAQMPTANKPASRKKRVIIFSILAVLFIGLGVAIAIAANTKVEPEGKPDDNLITPEEQRKAETLNPTLAERVKTNPHRDYESKNQYSFNYASVPDEIIYDYNLSIRNLDLTYATTIPAMNSNILNYYLDQDNTIVVIKDEKELTLHEKKSKTLIVYASVPQDCEYLTFIPEDFDENGKQIDEWPFPEQLIIHLTRSELFDQLSESAKFYVLRK